MHKSGLNKHIRLVSNFMTSQPGKQTIVIPVLPNISKGKGNQTMRFNQLIEYIMRNAFLEKSYKKCSGETSPRSLSKNQN